MEKHKANLPLLDKNLQNKIRSKLKKIEKTDAFMGKLDSYYNSALKKLDKDLSALIKDLECIEIS